MKRIILGILLFASPAYANTISLETISADSSATVHNSNFSTIATLMNGSVEGSCDGGATVCNVTADSIFEINMADNANPRLRDAELLGIGADSSSGGSLTQNTVVESGCVPADDTDLTSDISACVVYVSGYRVSKAATANTYTASRDCYVDLSQSGVYTTTCVTNGATAPSVAANSSRLAKVVTDGTEITTITSLYTTRVPGLIIPANYRTGLAVSKDSTTTLTVFPGSAEINNSMVTKTTTTTLTISTAGDYAGGSSLRAADTYGYVGMDSSGNLKLHTTAPTHDNYAVSTTVGKKRFATWSSTVYRILGWFYMDGAQLVENASNIKEFGIPNAISSTDTNTATTASAVMAQYSKANFYNSGGNVLLTSVISGDSSAAAAIAGAMVFRDGSTDITNSGVANSGYGAGAAVPLVSQHLQENVAQSTKTYSAMVRSDGSVTYSMRRRALRVEEQ